MYYLIFDNYSLRLAYKEYAVPEREYYAIFCTREAAELAYTIVDRLFPSSQFTPEQQYNAWFQLIGQ